MQLRALFLLSRIRPNLRCRFWWVLLALATNDSFAQTPAAKSPQVPASGQGRFSDVTGSSGIRGAVTGHYARYTNWWLSGLNLVDLDGDGHLDLFLAAHGTGRSLALLNDGHGQF